MRFLADMGVAPRVVEWLRKEGHDAVHLREQGLERLPDIEIFDKAESETRVILTFDLDFAEIVALSDAQGSSVIVFRLRDTRTMHVIERRERFWKSPAMRSHRAPSSPLKTPAIAFDVCPSVVLSNVELPRTTQRSRDHGGLANWARRHNVLRAAMAFWRAMRERLTIELIEVRYEALITDFRVTMIR